MHTQYLLPSSSSGSATPLHSCGPRGHGTVSSTHSSGMTCCPGMMRGAVLEVTTHADVYHNSQAILDASVMVVPPGATSRRLA
jgi:hypothetical protein